MLPNLLIGMLVLIVFWFLARLACRLIKRQLARHSRDNLGEVLRGFVQWSVVLVGSCWWPPSCCLRSSRAT